MELLTSRQPADIAQAIAEHEEHALQILLSLPMEKAARTLYKLEPVLREAVVQDWTAEKSTDFNEKMYASLRDQYTIVIEEPEEEDELDSLPETGQ